MIRALLFDFDGVVVDSEVPRYESWRELYVERGVDLELADWLPAVGSGSSVAGAFDAVAHLERLTDTRVDRDDAIARRTRRLEELLVDVPLLPGVAELLVEARAAGLATAVVTRNRDTEVARHCREAGLDHAWTAIRCANDEPTRDKAELYREALAALGAQPAEALAFEDSPAGVRAAREAGVVVAAVPNAVTAGGSFPEAHFVLPSLARPLDEILHLAELARPEREGGDPA